MPKKKKEEAAVYPVENKQELKSAVINYGSVSIELHYDRSLGKCYGIIFDDGTVKRFEAEVK